MKKTSFNQGWKVSKIDGKILGQQINGFPEGREVTLPHDAMIEEKISADCINSTQTAHFPGGYYRYTKEFTAPPEWKNKTVTLEFEGAYMNSRVYLNNDHVGGCHYGYSNFYVELDHSLLYGKVNRVEVLVNNEALNSRWYTGSGLYRNVQLYIGEPVHFAIDGIRISTPDVEKDFSIVQVQPCIKNEDRENHKLQVKTEILDMEGRVVSEETSTSFIYGRTEQTLYQKISVLNPQLWDCDDPYLYTCRLTLQKDGEETEQTELKFGIRKLQLDSIHGLRINGKQVKLRGACVHHDNGVIGACTLEMAEERKCRLLKEAGFNCIRSSHHPAGKALLDACDKYGMLVMDELSDMWTWPKNINDYATYFDTDWEKDVTRMVEKDFNHPSVIMYSTGNEIQEVGTPKGVDLNRRIAEKIRSLDSTRYVTNAFNGLLAAIDYEQVICSDLREKAARESKGLNDIMGETIDIMDSEMISGMEVHPIMTEKIDAFMGSLDIAGYNYLTLRHEMDLERKPHRVVLGAETFPSDIAGLWDIVKRNPHVIGDMTWTGYDYLGETGLGVITFEEKTEERIGRTSWSGDIDITGKRRPISYLREIVYGLRKTPYIAVEDPAHYGMTQKKSKWAFEDSIPSWTWSGFEGKNIAVDIYSSSDEVELFINGKSLGKKPTGEQHQFTAKYEAVYEPGVLEVKAYYKDTVYTEKLHTAKEKLLLCAETDRKELQANGADLAFVTVELRDENSIVNMQERRNIAVEIEGNGIIQGYGNADPYFQGSYQEKNIPAFEGRVQAVVRAGFEPGEIKLIFSSEGCESVEMAIAVKKA
ncbi:MAG: glycoside hydrolase family 2 TIM barrel-domain containing protein [Eubacteriales bacterium]|nr:glycoside hydrolase family 2 TIM barrel-domain containing protein [Eubacteriales bacterium]